MTRALRLQWFACALLLLWLSGCKSLAEKREEASYAPTESVIEVVAVLRRHIPDDTYRFPPGTDYSGRNVYRASLLRLENLAKLHAGSLRAGHIDEVIQFSQARALERLRAYDLASQHFDQASKSEVLQRDAQRGANLNAAIAEALSIGIPLADPMGANTKLPGNAELVVAQLDERVAIFTTLLRNDPPAPYPAILREEIERADVTRARYFTAMRHALENGNLRAVAEWQRVIARHSASKLRRRHMIEAANLYVELAHEYVFAKPPESLSFDPPMFRELVDGATHLYEAVAHQDGTPEKLEASRRLEAFLAFTLQVDGGRFTN